MKKIINATAAVLTDMANKGKIKKKYATVKEERVVSTQEEFNEAMLDPNVILVVDEKSPADKVCTIEVPATDETAVAVEDNNTKEETIMSEVKERLSSAKESVSVKLAGVKESGFKETASDFWVFIKKQASKLGSFIKKHSTAIFVATGSTIVAGAVTTGATAAACVGIPVASAIALAQEMIAKKKEGSFNYKAFLSKVAIGVAVAFALPYVLYAAAYLGLMTTVYGFILPYAIIVA